MNHMSDEEAYWRWGGDGPTPVVPTGTATCDHCGGEWPGDDGPTDYLFTCDECCRRPCSCCDCAICSGTGVVALADPDGPGRTVICDCRAGPSAWFDAQRPAGPFILARATVQRAREQWATAYEQVRARRPQGLHPTQQSSTTDSQTRKEN